MDYLNTFLKKCNLKNRASTMNKELLAKEDVKLKAKIKKRINLTKYGEWQQWNT